MKRSLLFLLLLALFMPWAAQAQTRETLTFDFEDGAIPSAWTNNATYPWVVTQSSQNNGHSGTYCIMSSNATVSNSTSSIQATFTFVDDGSISFLGGIFGEGSSTAWDKCIFSIDGNEQWAYGALGTWNTYTFEVEAGEHTFVWTYTKDSSVNPTGDAFFIDDVVVDLGVASNCPKPTGLNVALTPGNGTVATLSWTSEATAWQICLNNDETNLIAATTNPFQLTGLTPETTYTAKVRTNCGSEQSGWSNVVTFTPTDSYQVTVNDGTTTNGYVPIYGYYVDAITKSQFIIPANSLEDLTYGTITNMTFYAQADKNWGAAQFEVYMTETDETTVSALVDYTTMDKVMNAGSLSIIDNQMVVTLDAPYQYMGGNLMIGFLQTTTGTYSSCLWYGVTATGASMGGYGTSISQQNFLPKTTFSYLPGVAPTCPKPRNLNASNVTSRTAEISWVAGGEETAWQLCLNGNENSPINVTTNPYTLTGLDPETTYTVKLRANCGGGDLSDWTAEISFTTEIACPAPTNVTITDVEPFGATITWDGSANSYNLRYREPSGFRYGFEEAEEWAVDDFAPCTTYDGDLTSTYGFEGYSFPNQNYVGACIAWQNGINDSWSAHSGNACGMIINAIVSQYPEGVTHTNDFFILPELTIAAGDVFSFWAREVETNYGPEIINVGVYDSDGTFSTLLAENVSVASNSWAQYSYSLDNLVGQTIKLAINVVSHDVWAFMFDDIFVGNPNDTNWDATLYDVSSPYVLTGLSEETLYEVQVQSACGSVDGTSVWVDAGTFTTPSACSAPNNLASTDITFDEATLSWNGFTNTYNLRYRTAESRDTYYFNDFNSQLADGWTYDGLWIYGFSDPIYQIAGDDNYFMAMGWNSTDEETIISCELPEYEFGAVVEFYYFGYSEANTFQVGYSTTTNDADAFTWSDPIDAPLSTYTLYQEGLGIGVKYIAWKATASQQEASVFIDDFGIFSETTEASAWATITGVTSSYTLDGLTDNTKYEWQVQGVKTSCDGGTTDWSKMAYFTTLNACEAPTNLEAIDITSTSATLTWEGIQDDYSVRYRELAHLDGIVFEEDFSNGIGDWTMVDCVTGGGANVVYTNAFSFYYTTEPPQYLISPELTGIEGLHLRFLYAAYSANFPESFMVGYSSTGNDVTTDFTWGDEITTSNTSGAYYDEVIPAGTKYFAIQCTSYDAFYLSVTYFTIYESIIPTGDWIEEDARDTELEISDLNPGLGYQWQVKGADCDDMSWSSLNTFYTLEAANGQTTDLAEGWNWFSIHVAIDDPEQAMLMLQQSLGDNASQIKSSEDFNMYYDGEWDAMGDLTEVDNLNMYMILVENNCTVNLTGTNTNPADYSITINPGWNWIGFPSNEVIAIEDAFANFAAEDEDRIVSAEEFSMFYDGEWGAMGDLEELTPGQGFMYFYNGTTPTTLVFGTSAKRDSANAKLEKVINVQKRQTARITIPSKSVNK